MKTEAVTMNGYGGPETLTLTEVDLPEPGPDEVVLRVLAVAVNHLDADLRSGVSRMPLRLPHVLGREVVGVVERLGSRVTDRAAGDRVLVLPNTPCGACPRCLGGRANLCPNADMPGITRWGGYARHAVAPARGLLDIGDLDPVVAASTPISFGTAWRTLYSIGRLAPGEWVLAPGAAGGLGHAVVQLAKLGGARVVGLIGDPTKADFVASLGADAVLSTRDPDWAAEAREITGGAGFDVIVEHVGGDVFEAALGTLAPTGRLIVGGGHAGEHPHLDLIETFRNEYELRGSRSQRPDEIARVLGLVAAGQLTPRVDAVLALADAGRAHQALADRRVLGKQVITP
ncbi:D-arabinose 1-dehydrogenase, Zn-dependent alcohol dehydrogenase family [Micromonospora matsumotoense]|uniref:D-arabinose 1-dehydrogenase, Zn-dependent alcohol dehydrogenase family n=1 Tax=Micromonospora matsumotoense TaxID=121616 RepID=A0A1C4V3R9_9ACTN|nr:zinc-binding dehydrogenase [Micromonospora matsumotoense]SCE78399.1 D-arabinose 1-dehydrogenase, Zn-dependent alcohol dehydrogenase family [Micromonospora matsumotoense]